jgi:DNA-binding response OmpR family regulator
MRILVVEDNDLVADAIARGLGIAGFAVDRAPSAELAATALAAEHFDLAVVDIGLPGEDGLTFVRRLRRQGSTLPVLILTARETVAMRVEALDLGADDFLMKPFEQSELAARCRALIRRANLNTNGQLNFGRLRIDVAGRQLRIDDKPVELTGASGWCSSVWRSRPGEWCQRSACSSTIARWDQAMTPNAVEVYVSRVRAKLADAALIRTVRGLGYRLDEPEA